MTWWKAAVGVVCGYEAVAIFSSRTPTVSVLCGRHRWLIPVVVGGLTVHLLLPPRKEHACPR